MTIPRILIIGGGFAGINAALGLKKAAVDLILIDKTNHHLFQPLLYQVATAALSENNIAIPFRDILAKQKNAKVVMDEVIAIDKTQKHIRLLGGDVLAYDYLIVAPDNRPSYFGHDKEWSPFAPGLKTLSDALLHGCCGPSSISPI